MLLVPAQAHHIQHPVRFFDSHLRRFSAEHERQGDILQRIHRSDEMERLKNKTDIFPAEPHKVIFFQLLNMTPAYNDLAFRGPLKPRQHVEERRFSGPAGANDRAELSLMYLETHAVQRPDDRISYAVEFIKIAYCYRFYPFLPLSVA